MKNEVSFVLDDKVTKNIEVDLEDSIPMGLDIKDELLINSFYENSNVISIEPDHPIAILEDANLKKKQSVQNMQGLKETIPYGVELVLQKREKFHNMKAKGKAKVCVVDTGYDINHVDLPKSYVIGKDGLGER